MSKPQTVAQPQKARKEKEIYSHEHKRYDRSPQLVTPREMELNLPQIARGLARAYVLTDDEGDTSLLVGLGARGKLLGASVAEALAVLLAGPAALDPTAPLLAVEEGAAPTPLDCWPCCVVLPLPVLC